MRTDVCYVSGPLVGHFAATFRDKWRSVAVHVKLQIADLVVAMRGHQSPVVECSSAATENPCVGGSIPPLATVYSLGRR